MMRMILKLMLLPLLCLPATGTESFLAPGFDSGRGLPEDRIYPQGRIFPFSGFSPADTAAMKQAGYTMAGPVYSEYQIRNLTADAERKGLFMIYPVQPEADGVRLTKKLLDAPDFNAKPYLKSIAAQVKKNAVNRRIAWWYLGPEELRPWRKRDMVFLKAAAETIRENDPERRPVWLYLPNHYTKEQMIPVAEALGVVGKGMYPTQLKKEDERVWCRWSAESEAQAVAETGAKAVPIAVPEMFRQPEAKHLDILEKLVRHDVYLSLVSGAKGVVVFSLAKRPGFDAYDRYFDAYAQIARELAGEKKLGELFLFGKRLDRLKVEVVSGPAAVAVDVGINNKKDVREYPSVAFAEIGYRDRRTLFLVNSAPEAAVKVRVSGLPEGKVGVADLISGRNAVTVDHGGFEVELQPYEVKCLRFVAE